MVQLNYLLRVSQGLNQGVRSDMLLSGGSEDESGSSGHCQDLVRAFVSLLVDGWRLSQLLEPAHIP